MTTETLSRRCIGSSRFGIEAHDADAGDFPVQPSQKDGLGRMCKTHWREYTDALRKAALARKAEADAPASKPEPEVASAPEPVDQPKRQHRGKPGAPRPNRRRGPTPRSYHLATTGPGHEFGACLHAVEPGRHQSGARCSLWPCGGH